MKLKLHLAQFMNTVEMRVLEQEGISESLSGRVRLSCYPELFDNRIYVRGGASEYNHVILCKIFETEDKALAYIAKVIRWLDEIFYANGDKEIKKSNNVDVRYVTAEGLECRKYGDFIAWCYVRKLKQSGYNPDIKEYYGEITNKE
jgi:hypothetical protein